MNHFKVSWLRKLSLFYEILNLETLRYLFDCISSFKRVTTSVRENADQNNS